MNKGLQIFLLVLLLGLSCTCGYFVGEVIFEKKSDSAVPTAEKVAEEVTPVVEPAVEPVIEPEPEVVLSPNPQIREVSKPKRNNDGTYYFEATAYVESGDDVVFELCKDTEFASNIFKTNRDGVFDKVKFSANDGKYYLRARNLNTNDSSEIIELEGFDYVKMYTKITAAEIEKLVNVDKDWSAAPGDFSSRISKLKIDVVNLKEGERGVSNLSDVCNKTMFGTWQSIKVEGTPSYDGQGRLTYLKIRVNY